VAKTPNIDVSPAHWAIIAAILKRLVPDAEVWAFGSRAKWIARDTSDLDLALIADAPLPLSRMAELKEAFSESDVPFKVDVVDWAGSNEDFRRIIREQHVIVQPNSFIHSRIADPGLGWLYRPEFPSEWRRQSLYSLADWLNGMAFRDIEFTPSGRPVIKIAEIKEGIAGQTKFTDRSYDERYLVRSGDMLFSWAGQPETSLDVSWWRGPEGWLNQHIFKVTPHAEKCTPDFLFYLLKYLKRNFIGIARNKQTTGLGHVTKADLERIEVGVPPKSVQNSITAILRPLDDLIDLNRRTNETLEQIARTLFNHYFPYSPDDDLPEGWRVGTIGEVAENPRLSVSADEIAEETAYIGLEHMPRRSIALTEWDISAGLASGKFRFVKGDILFGKLRPYFHKVGIAPIDGVCSTDILVIRSKRPGWHSFVLGHVSSDAFVRHADGSSTGTKMPRSNWHDMARYAIAVPPGTTASNYNRQAKLICELILSNIHQSRTLAALRDLLLPKLMSGEIRVST